MSASIASQLASNPQLRCRCGCAWALEQPRAQFCACGFPVGLVRRNRLLPRFSCRLKPSAPALRHPPDTAQSPRTSSDLPRHASLALRLLPRGSTKTARGGAMGRSRLGLSTGSATPRRAAATLPPPASAPTLDADASFEGWLDGPDRASQHQQASGMAFSAPAPAASAASILCMRLLCLSSLHPP